VLKLLGKWLKIYREEMGLFLWSALLLFLIRSSSVLLNNYAETAFLKRYGIVYLPLMYMVNSVVTFVIMGLIGPLVARMKGSRLLLGLLLFCGSSIAGMRLLIPTGIASIYPVLFVMKTQYEVMLGLFFWNLVNDLFNTRQSKRLFPLITAGGVLGAVLGSLTTPMLARLVALDNLLFVYLATTCSGAFTVFFMAREFPLLLLGEAKVKKIKKRSGIIEEIKQIFPILRESRLLKILIFLTFLPNLVIPLMNFQFNFAVNEAFATEGGMLAFFGYFRGILNMISFVILLFVGRLYGRWGIPVALMFHPVNYAIAFTAFLLRFDLYSAVYARISTNIIRTTINNPARAVLMGLFPSSARAVVRPFLRGTVVRVGTLLGSGMVMISERLFHPRFLSIGALLIVSGWIYTVGVLRRQYSKILLDLISKNVLDLKTMDPDEVSEIFQDKKALSQLTRAFLSSKGTEAIWYVEFLSSLNVPNFDKIVLQAAKDETRPAEVRLRLVSMLGQDSAKEAILLLEQLCQGADIALVREVAKVASRFSSNEAVEFLERLYVQFDDPEVRAHCIRRLYPRAPEKYRAIILDWLQSQDIKEQRAGIVAAGGSKDPSFIPRLRDILERKKRIELIPEVLSALVELGDTEVEAVAARFLDHPSQEVRLSALKAIEIHDDQELSMVIKLLGDPWPEIAALAIEKILKAPYQNIELLIEHLTVPKRKVREGLYKILEHLGMKDLDVFRFIKGQLAKAYEYMAVADSLILLGKGEMQELLKRHLEERKNFCVENVLRILVLHDQTEEMRIIWKGLNSADSRERANALEALEGVLDRSIAKIMLPLLEGDSAQRVLSIGRKEFDLPRFFDKWSLIRYLLLDVDWVCAILTLHIVRAIGVDKLPGELRERLLQTKDERIRRVVGGMLGRPARESQRGGMMEGTEREISLPDRILHLKKIEIFEDLAVSELAAIASVTREEVYEPGEVVIREGEKGDTFYLIVEGEVSVLKLQPGGRQLELDRIGAGDYFGEMALFEDIERSATVKTLTKSRFLVLNKQEFREIVREFPEIALNICKVLGRRIRRLHEKLKRAGIKEELS